MKSHKIYFDNNATAPLDPRVVHAIEIALKQPMGNPSSPHFLGQTAKSELSKARRTLASYCQAAPSQIIFTSGGSEGALLTIRGLIPPKSQIISSPIEHPCVTEVLEGYEVISLPVGLEGRIHGEDLEKAISPKTGALIFMGANNETGVKNDLEAISEIALKRKLPLIVDGVSLLGKDSLKIPDGVSAMFFSGHKIHAPQGIGFIYLKKGVKLIPQIRGGPQEFGMRGGTENMLGIIGLAAAIQILAEEGDKQILRIKQMRDRLEQGLLEIPGVKVNGTGPRVCNTTNLSFGNRDGEGLLIALDQAGIAVSLGSACSSGAIEPSRVLLQMGVPLIEARSSLRFSLSRLNTMDEVEAVIQLVKLIV